jgi:hypothetical protein
MLDAASVGRGRLARHILCKRWGSARHLATMGSARQGQAIKGGHFFAEENPEDTAVVVKRFLSAESMEEGVSYRPQPPA